MMEMIQILQFHVRDMLETIGVGFDCCISLDNYRRYFGLFLSTYRLRDISMAY